jgi:hypothetical protein
MPPKNRGSTYESFPEHPLFPVDDGEDTPQVDFITVSRKDRGVMVFGPSIKAEELTSTEQIFERFGGGMFELWARARGTTHPDLPNKITKRRWVNLPGRPKPLSQDPTVDELRASDLAPPAPSSTISAPSSPGHPGGMGDGVLVAILQMQQQASQQFMALMLEMMKSGKTEAIESAKAQAESTKQFTQLMMTMSAQQQQSMLGMMTAMMQSRGGGPEELEKYATLLKSIGFGTKERKSTEASSDSVGAIVENIADIVQGGVQLMQSRGLPVGQPNGESAPAAAPGSAASVLPHIDPGLG